MGLLGEAEPLAHRGQGDPVDLVDGGRPVELGQGVGAQGGVRLVAGGGEVVELLVVAGDAEVGRGDRAERRRTSPGSRRRCGRCRWRGVPLGSSRRLRVLCSRERRYPSLLTPAPQYPGQATRTVDHGSGRSTTWWRPSLGWPHDRTPPVDQRRASRAEHGQERQGDRDRQAPGRLGPAASAGPEARWSRERGRRRLHRGHPPPRWRLPGRLRLRPRGAGLVGRPAGAGDPERHVRREPHDVGSGRRRRPHRRALGGRRRGRCWRSAVRGSRARPSPPGWGSGAG